VGEIWLLTGSQSMYGEGTLRQVESQSRTVSERLIAAVAADTRAWEIGGFGRDLNTRNGIIAGEIDREYLDRLKTVVG
jgi:hypothetical protein